MRMRDAERVTHLFRALYQCRELARDGFRRLFVIEKHIARGRRDIRPQSRLQRDAARSRATVDEEQVATRDNRLHQPAHRVALAGQAATHVVIEPDRIRHRGERFRHRRADFRLRHVHHERAGAKRMVIGIGFHRQMDDHVLVEVVREPGEVLCVR